MRDFIYAANWKMHKTPEEAVEFFRTFEPALQAKFATLPSTAPNGGARRVIFFVPALCLASSVEAVKVTQLKVGGQNVHHELKGAFTGENSAAVLKSLGADWVLVGHSERRTLFDETDELTSLKMKTSIEQGLSAMLCVGETLVERESHQTLKVVERQLEVGLSKVEALLRSSPKRISIAYEPVWAIGTGKVATPDQASEVHQSIRRWLTTTYSQEVALEVSILYGGSVKPDNAGSIAAKADVDGFLVGGASLEPATFLGLF